MCQRISAQLNNAGRLSLALLLFFLFALPAQAVTKRIVVIKVDGLPYEEVDRFVQERDPRTGKSVLPWFSEVFYRNGTRVANFYTRGMSLSGPAWSLLDTGQHLQIKGNVEFDRLTLHSYDYLNFVPLYVNYGLSNRVDMAGVEVLDDLKLPLLSDAFPYEQRLAGFQLYQRGVRWTTLMRMFTEKRKQEPSDLISEWALGMTGRNLVQTQLQKDLIEKLADPGGRYFDYYETIFDHAAHHNRDAASHLVALQELDATLGRVWAAIQQSPMADETVLALVSDHGFNSHEKIYSQGYNLVKLLGSPEGGGHHVITKRRLLLDYAVKGIYPLVPRIVTTTPDSYYLPHQSTDYPTALLDFDGNERAAIHLRDSDLNVLHILLQQLRRKDLPAPQRGALREAFFDTIDRCRAEWTAWRDELNEELQQLSRDIPRQEEIVKANPAQRPWTPDDFNKGLDKEARRLAVRLEQMRGDFTEYSAYLFTLNNLLALNRETFKPEKAQIPDLIAKQSMGLPNTLHQLQNYVVGLSENGLAFDADGSLNLQRSFKRIDYLDLLASRTVRNNVQAGVGNRPVDFVALHLPAEKFGAALREFGAIDEQVIWVYSGPERQALILSSTDAQGGISLRYVPVAGFKQTADGAITFRNIAWQNDLPLRLWDDKALAAPDRAAFLNAWHTDLEWLRATHQTQYSNGVVGLHEQLARHKTDATDADAPGLSQEECLRRRFLRRQRELVETDLLILANNHWNFDVRGFNPGGNHGSFFRVSTHATLMFAGGAKTGVPRAAVVEEPYDSISFMPTVLALTGQLENGSGKPAPVLWQRGFRALPGRVIPEIVGAKPVAPVRGEAR